MTGQQAVHAETGETFDERAKRLAETSSTTEAGDVDA
jgi:hypothetical protein